MGQVCQLHGAPHCVLIHCRDIPNLGPGYGTCTYSYYGQDRRVPGSFYSRAWGEEQFPPILDIWRSSNTRRADQCAAPRDQGFTLARLCPGRGDYYEEEDTAQVVQEQTGLGNV